MPQAIFAYHLGMDAEQYAFFRIPKLLITEPYFRRLSTDAKLLYGLMLDRMSLSMRNGWMDDAKQINRIFERMGYPAPVKEDAATKKENARAPSGNSSKERGTGARASTEPAAEKADARPSVRSRLMALQAAAERDGTAPTKDTVREAIQKAMPTRE